VAATVSGVFLWAGTGVLAQRRIALRLSLLLQALQIPVVHTSVVGFMIYAPVRVFLGYSSDGPLSISLGGEVHGSVGVQTDPVVGVNVAAVGLAIALFRVLRDCAHNKS
jgi:hypothetical protein